MTQPDDRLAIGHDLDLLLDAVRYASTARRVSSSTIQRRVRVGWVKADRLRLLLAQEGIIGPADSRNCHEPVVTADGLAAALERVRSAAREEAGDERL